MVSLEQFIKESKLTGHKYTYGYAVTGEALINIKLKFRNFIFKKIVLADDFIQDNKLVHAYQIKKTIYDNYFK